MTSEIHVLEELANIVNNAPVDPGDTLSHVTANECVERGWARRQCGKLMPTHQGRRKLLSVASSTRTVH